MSLSPLSGSRVERLQARTVPRVRFVPFALALGVSVAALSVPRYALHAFHQDRAYLGADSRSVEDHVIAAEGVRPSVIAAAARLLPPDARYRIVVPRRLGSTVTGQALRLWLAVRLLPRLQVQSRDAASWLLVWSGHLTAEERRTAVLAGRPTRAGPPLYVVRLRG